MLKIKEYNKYIRFDKSIEDLYDDSGTGIFESMQNQGIVHVPAFLSVLAPTSLDLMLQNRFGERWLNRMGAGEYSVVNDTLVNPATLDHLVNQITMTYYRKWDNLLYLYMLEMGEDYNPIENYSSYEKTTYNSLKDELKKEGTEKNKQSQEIKQKPMKTVTKVSDEYGENGSNGIKDKTTYKRDYTDTSVSGTTSGGTTTPFKITEEKQIAGLNSTGYANSDKTIRDEQGTKTFTHKDNGANSSEETERTGKHSSTSEFGGDVQNGAVVQGDLQTITSLDPTTNYNELSFTGRTDTNTRTGNFEVEKTGNIGVMTASQMLESAWNGEIERNLVDVILQDVADFISLKCY